MKAFSDLQIVAHIGDLLTKDWQAKGFQLSPPLKVHSLLAQIAASTVSIQGTGGNYRSGCQTLSTPWQS